MRDHNRLLVGALLLAVSAGAFAQQNLAELRVYAFGPDGNPLRGVEIRLDGKSYTSDGDGVLVLKDVPGPKNYVIFWNDRPGASVAVTLRVGAPVEVIVTVGAEAPVHAVAEEAAKPVEKAAVVEPEAPLGVVTGVVVNFETRKPIAGATLLVRGSSAEARTDDEGKYSLSVPSGPRTLSIIHPQYATQTKDDVVVKPDAGFELDWELTPSSFQMEAVQIVSTEDIQVLGGVAALTDETRNSGAVLNLMGSEQIAKTGDSDAAGALGRVTGLTVVGGKYVFVRGMGERYSSSYMNGARLPSPELDRRVVPLDLFPTAVIESLAVQKTYSPELYGDFSGGAVTVRTLGVPSDRYQRRLRGSVAFSLGFDLDSVFRIADFQQTAATDWLGFDDGGRGFPTGVDPDRPINELQFAGDGGYTAAEMTALGRKFRNDWAPVSKLLLPDIGLTFSLRDKIDLDRTHRFGWSAALMYKHQMGLDESIDRQFGDNEGQNKSLDTVTATSSQEVNWSGLLNVEYEAEREAHYRSTTLFTRITNDDFSLTRGFQKEISDEKIYEESWVEQSMVNQALAGDWQVNWGIPLVLHTQYSLSFAGRYEPDHKLIGYGYDDISKVFDVTNKAGNTYRLYLGAQDILHDLAGSATLPFPFLGESSDQLTLGGQFIRQDRVVKNNRYTYTYKAGSDTTADLDDILSPGNIDNSDPTAISFFENTKPSDSYTGSQTVLAGYFNTDLVLFGYARTNAGLRAEQSTQVIDTFQLGQVQKVPETVVLSTIDLLPSVNVTLPVSRQLQARLGLSRTVNRPDFIEISNTIKEGLPGTGLYRGNPLLKRAEIWNADARVEQYFTPTESWSFGAFGKKFTNPIEVTESTGSSGEKTPVNVPSATNWGLELEWNLTLGGIADGLRLGVLGRQAESTEEFFWQRQAAGFWGGVLRDTTFTGNLAWIQSQVDYQGQDKGNNTSATRPLQGQSPWVVNLSLSYKNSVSWSPRVVSDTSATVSYNVFGPRLKRIGTGTLLDTYEQPFHQLDLVVKHRFDDAWSLDLKVKNLLDLPAVETLGKLIVAQETKGRTISVGGKYEF